MLSDTGQNDALCGLLAYVFDVGSIDELTNSINGSNGTVGEASTGVGAAKARADELTSALSALGAEGRAADMRRLSQQLDEVQTVLTGLRDKLDEIQTAAEATKHALPVGDSAPTRTSAAAAPTFSLAPGYPADKPHTMSWSDLHHVVHGDDDDETSGGHLHGTGRPGKTEFPDGWDDADIHDALIEAALRPQTTMARPRGKWFADSVHRGVTVRAVVRQDGSVEAGWPVSGPGVKRNPR